MPQYFQKGLKFFQAKKGYFLFGLTSFLILYILLYAVKVIFFSNKPVPKPAAQILSKNGRVAGKIVIKFRVPASDTEINELLKPYNARLLQRISALNSAVVEVPVGKEDAVIESLKQSNFIQYAEPDFIRTIQMVPNDADFAKQWGLKNTGQIINNTAGTVNMDINVEPAWDVSTGNGVKVGVLDTGIDLTHPDLSSKVAAQKVFVTTSIDDAYGHGTHVAGIIAATTNNSQGIAGVCPGCQLIIAKVMDDQGIGDTAVVSQGITWAADNGAKVINLSEGGPQNSQVEADAVNYAFGKGAVVVAAAGNGGVNQQFYPAAMPNVVSVTAIDNKGAKPSFANYGTWVNLTAPGDYIYSTLPTKAYGMQSVPGLSSALNYDFLSGTSMAAPVVSGVAALVWTTQYGTSPTSVVSRLLTTADKISGTGTNWADGKVNAGNAVGPAAATPTPTPTLTPTPTQTPMPTVTSMPTQTPSPTTGSTTPTPPYVTPTIYCLGSCPTNIPSPVATSQPTSVPTLTPTINPCNTAQIVNVQSHHDDHNNKKNSKSKSSGSSWLSSLMDLLKQILQYLINFITQLLGGSGIVIPTPGTPTPAPTSAAQYPTSTPAISNTINPTATPTVFNNPTPTINPCLTLTPAPTNAQPTAAQSSPTPIQTPTPTPAITSANPSTSPTPGVISQYKNLVFFDDFTGTGISTSNWSLYSGSGNDGIGTRNPSADTVSNGELLITGTGDVSGGMSSKKSFTYGLYEIRAKMDKGSGYGPAIMLWPSGSGGDICISEIPLGDRAESDFTIHYGGSQIGTSSTGDFSQWHTFTVEWTAAKITYYLDGVQEYTTSQAGAIPAGPLDVVLQNDIGAAGHYIPGKDANTPAQVALHVDWVKVYQ